MYVFVYSFYLVELIRRSKYIKIEVFLSFGILNFFVLGIRKLYFGFLRFRLVMGF